MQSGPGFFGPPCITTVNYRVTRAARTALNLYRMQFFRFNKTWPQCRRRDSCRTRFAALTSVIRRLQGNTLLCSSVSPMAKRRRVCELQCLAAGLAQPAMLRYTLILPAQPTQRGKSSTQDYRLAIMFSCRSSYQNNKSVDHGLIIRKTFAIRTAQNALQAIFCTSKLSVNARSIAADVEVMGQGKPSKPTNTREPTSTDVSTTTSEQLQPVPKTRPPVAAKPSQVNVQRLIASGYDTIRYNNALQVLSMREKKQKVNESKKVKSFLMWPGGFCSGGCSDQKVGIVYLIHSLVLRLGI